MRTALKKLQPEASTVHTSPFNRMENERLRIRVHRNEENAEIRPKPPVEHVTTVEPSSARVPKKPYAVLHKQHPFTRRVPKIRRTPTPKHEGEGNIQISKCKQRDEAARRSGDSSKSHHDGLVAKHSLHQQLLQATG